VCLRVRFGNGLELAAGHGGGAERLVVAHYLGQLELLAKPRVLGKQLFNDRGEFGIER